jgi:hypothetical protein
MLVLLRRYLALAALFFWQGGFTFYASVVVPVGQDVLGSHVDQGFITQQVTGWLNYTGFIALVPLAGEWFLTPDACGWRRHGRLALGAAMVLTLAGLFVLHGRLDPYLDPGEHILLNPRAFRPLHRLYLWTQTVQWLAAVLYLALTLAAWRAEDHSMRPGNAGDVDKREAPTQGAEAVLGVMERER